MPKVTYIESDGTTHEVEGDEGQSLMQIAVDNMIPGILGDCGGSCSCATCHVYVDAPWDALTSKKSEDEAFVLEGAIDVRQNSRLACQIRMKAELDGFVLHVPVEQPS